MSTPSPEVLRAQAEYDRNLKGSAFRLRLIRESLAHFRQTAPTRGPVRH